MSGVATLNDVCEFIVDCLHATAPVQDQGFPLIRTPNIGKGRLLLDGVYRVSEDTYRTWTQRATPQAGDLILAREAPAGNVAVVKEGEDVCLGQRTVHLRPDKTKVDPDYLCYLLLTPSYQGRLLAAETGVTAKHVNMKDIRRLKLDALPTIEQQRHMGQVIAAYDDLIENNRRRIALLEQSARLLYREWFVHLRFPGHEHVKVVDGMPEGWERKTMADAAETVGGGTPSTAVSAYWDDGEITWFSPTDLTNNDCLALLSSAKKITEAGLKNSSAKMLPPETILMSSRASIGYFGLHDKPACTNQGFISLIPRDEQYRYYLLYNLMFRKDEIESKAGGTTYKEINKSTFRGMTITWPEKALASSFSEFAMDVMQQVRALKRQNEKLAQARDLLLPRLMSGGRMC